MDAHQYNSSLALQLPQEKFGLGMAIQALGLKIHNGQAGGKFKQ